ncbi:MAG: hypothetical protein AB7I22_20360 [Ramlibacter sp.]
MKVAVVRYLRSRLVLLAIVLLCLVAGLAAVLRLGWAFLVNEDRAWKLSVAFDQLGNAAGNGDPDETISSRAGKARLQGRVWGCVLCKVLDWLDPDHCARMIERDRGKRIGST